MKPNHFISKHPIFSKLTARDQQKLLDLAISKNYHQGEWLVHAGDIWPYLFLLTDGSVNAVKESAEARSLIIETIHPNEVLWGLAFFNPGTPMPVALIAAEDCQLLLWSRNRAMPVLLDNGAATWEICTLMTRRIQRASDVVEELAFHPVAGRLARFLVKHFGDSEKDRVPRDLTLDEMAAHIGSTREMVSRVLHGFSNQGIIDITRTEFVFTDRENLHKLAQTSQ